MTRPFCTVVSCRIWQTWFIRRVALVVRYLANKASIASRIDCFMEVATSAFGEKMKEQVEERLRFYEDGVAPTKNITAMQV